MRREIFMRAWRSCVYIWLAYTSSVSTSKGRAGEARSERITRVGCIRAETDWGERRYYIQLLYVYIYVYVYRRGQSVDVK